MKDVILTPSAEHLKIKGLKFSSHSKNGVRKFPDDEVYVQVEGLEHVEDPVIIHSGMPEPNKGLMYLYGVLELLKDTKSPEVVFTYFPYGMQDEEFFEGTLNYAESVVRKLVDYYDVEKIYAIEPHFKNCEWVDDYPLEFIEADFLIQEIGGKVVGPDQGAEERLNIQSFVKRRKTSETVELDGQIDYSGEEVTVVDDLVETGGTMSAVYEELTEEFDTVNAAIIHGVLEKGASKVKEKFDSIYITNTIGNTFSNFRIEDLIREEILQKK